jgi:hypothetical protein
VPYARSLHGSTLTVGLLMAAVPLGMVIGAYRLAAAAAFVQALRPDTRARAAQSGLYAVQGLGILAGGAVAQLIGARSPSAWPACSA